MYYTKCYLEFCLTQIDLKLDWLFSQIGKLTIILFCTQLTVKEMNADKLSRPERNGNVY